jgi:hypothetical protein
MKKLHLKKSFWQSLLSLLALAVFVLLATGTIPGTSQQKRKLPDGRYELSKQYSEGNTETIVGNVDKSGRFDGPVKITYENSDYILTHTEEVNMKAGERHGTSKITYPNGDWVTHCYQHGKRVDDSKCKEKSAIVSTLDNSGYAIFSYKYPWFAFKLDAMGFDSTYVKTYLDTLELLLYANEFGEAEFDDYYNGVIDELEETAYDSIVQMNAELSLYNGLDLILNHEFRLATLGSFIEGDSNTYLEVKSVYTNYLLTLNSLEVTDADFEAFCHEYDSIMSSYAPMDIDGPLLVDSLDGRMYRTLDYMYNVDENAAAESAYLKSALLSNHLSAVWNGRPAYVRPAEKQALEKTPQEVSEIVLYTILESFIHGDLIKNAVKEAFNLNKGIIGLPSVTTTFGNYNSSTSVTLSGNVIDNGGGEVTARGMAWGTIFNPTMDDEMVASGDGTGDFTVTVSGLTEGETYYARTFATNSAGSAYGNCISFVAESSIGVELRKPNTRDFSIFPNPAMDQISLKFKAEDPSGVVFTMFDLNGKMVLRERLESVIVGENMIRINISEIEGGMYTCTIGSDKGTRATQKLIINR